MRKTAYNPIYFLFSVCICVGTQSAMAQEASNTPRSLAIDLTRQFTGAPDNSIQVLETLNADASVEVTTQASNSSCRFLARQVADQWAAENFECSKDAQNAYK